MEAQSGVAYGPRIARLSKDMLSFHGGVHELSILGEDGKPLPSHDHDRRFFEAAWMHKYQGKYYFSYSTGDTHYLCYATGDSPFGPFAYRGRILSRLKAGRRIIRLFSIRRSGVCFITTPRCLTRIILGVLRCGRSSTAKMEIFN
jgi:hypothetical protein